MNEIQKLRAKTGLSQSKFAEKFHLKIATVQSWEHNLRQPSEGTIYMITRILDLEDKYEKEGQ